MNISQLLKQACLSGDVRLFRTVVQENNVDILGHRFQPSSNTALHLTSRLDHRELVAEILRMRPELVMEVNDRSDTPLHEACREGHVEVVKMLMEVGFNVVYRLNGLDESGLLLACSRGHSSVAELLLTDTKLLAAEEEGLSSSLHAAAIGGHTDIVRHILEIRPDFAQRTDTRGRLPIHVASSKGYLGIVRELISKMDMDFYLRRDGDGFTPLQLAVINGRLEVIDEILKAIPKSSRASTADRDGLLHLGIKNDQFGSVKRILESTGNNINSQDSDGNTILHLATSKGISVMVDYLLRSGVAINTTNNGGFTALDLVHDDTSSSGSLICNKLRAFGTALNFVNDDTSSSGSLIDKALRTFGGKRGVELKVSNVAINRKNDAGFIAIDLAGLGDSSSSGISTVGCGKRKEKLQVKSPQSITSSPTKEITSRRSSGLGESRDLSPPTCSSRQIPIMSPSSRKKRKKKLEHHIEGLRNARNTIIIVAVLIATLSFAAGINPPGGVLQDSGKSVVGNSPAFIVFVISNEIALFLSLSIVALLVSFIPFQHRYLKKLLVLTYKIMWASLSFMAVAYVAAIWVIMPTSRKSNWVIMEVVLAVGGGTIFVTTVVVGHWISKRWPRMDGMGLICTLSSPKSLDTDTDTDTDSSLSGLDIV